MNKEAFNRMETDTKLQLKQFTKILDLLLCRISFNWK